MKIPTSVPRETKTKKNKNKLFSSLWFYFCQLKILPIVCKFISLQPKITVGSQIKYRQRHLTPNLSHFFKLTIKMSAS